MLINPKMELEKFGWYYLIKKQAEFLCVIVTKLRKLWPKVPMRIPIRPWQSVRWMIGKTTRRTDSHFVSTIIVYLPSNGAKNSGIGLIKRTKSIPGHQLISDQSTPNLLPSAQSLSVRLDHRGHSGCPPGILGIVLLQQCHLRPQLSPPHPRNVHQLGHSQVHQSLEIGGLVTLNRENPPNPNIINRMIVLEVEVRARVCPHKSALRWRCWFPRGGWRSVTSGGLKPVIQRP